LGITFVLLTFENVWLFVKHLNFALPILLALVYFATIKYKKFKKKEKHWEKTDGDEKTDAGEKKTN
jgi:hypothetical protein